MPKVNKEKEKELLEDPDEGEKLSRKDYAAMILSALLTFIPAALAVLLFMYLLIWIFFM